MSDQLSLLESPATRGASRSTDPHTSRGAARSMEGQTLRDQQALVLGAVCDLHRRHCVGANAWEVYAHLDGKVQQNVIAKRLGELRDLGYVLHREGDVRPGPSNRNQLVFTPSMAGKAWIAGGGS